MVESGTTGRRLGRRDFLRGALALGGAAALGSTLVRSTLRLPFANADVVPAESGIEHIVVVMMENRSFDHFLGWLPNADGIPPNLRYQDETSNWHDVYPLAPDYTGCGRKDPDHSWAGGRIQYNGGAMDGFLKGDNDIYAIGYYGEDDRPVGASLARHYTACDRFFCSILAETYPNRFFMHAAQTDRLHNMGVSATAISPTIWDRLAAKGVSATYYFNDLPFLGLWGQKYIPISAPYAQFLAQAEAGRLPAVSFVDPSFLGEGNNVSADDHPAADIRKGDLFIYEIFRALTAPTAKWENTVLVITYDEWGGFFDHVAPPRAAAPAFPPGFNYYSASASDSIHPPNASPHLDDDVVDGKALLGFRIPVVIVSPFTKGADPQSPRVDHTVFDNTSILKLIEWRWGLVPMTARDASSDVGNVLSALDFTNKVTDVPEIKAPKAPLSTPCQGSTGFQTDVEGPSEEWAQLAASPLMKGWKLGI